MPRGMTRGPQGVAAPFGRADRLPIRPCSRTKPDTPAPLASGGTDDSASQRATGLPELTRRHRRRVGKTQHGRGAGGTSEVKVTTGRRVGRTSGEETMSRTMTGGSLPLVGRTGIARSAETKKGRSAPTRQCCSLDTGQGWERRPPRRRAGIASRSVGRSAGGKCLTLRSLSRQSQLQRGRQRRQREPTRWRSTIL